MKKRKKNSAYVRAKMAKVMHEFGAGTLKSSSGQKVTDRKQAVAIGYSEGRGKK